MATKFNWRGDEVFKSVIAEVLRPALRDFGLDVEGEAKGELYKGHGVLTGTLRRSIHTAEPGYNWRGDNIEPSGGTPERGGKNIEPKEKGGRMSLEIGSGMEYALAVHQGHRSFGGYHYLTNGLQKAAPRLNQHLERHKLR